MRIKHIEIRNFRGIKSLKWTVKGTFNCIIGAGDTCKTTILSALDYALAPRTSLSIVDSDFFNQNVNENIVIRVTLTGWDESDEDVRRFFQESKYAQYKCGLNDAGPLPEPGDVVAVSVSLRVDESLEPKWHIVKGRDEGEETEKKPIYSSDRAVLGLSRIDIYSDFHFTWGRNTILTRLSSESEGNLMCSLGIVTKQDDLFLNALRQVIQRQCCKAFAAWQSGFTRPVADSALKALCDFLFTQRRKILTVTPAVFCSVLLVLLKMLPKGRQPEFLEHQW
ncbi:AAA ATPase domain-containing protein [Nitrosomonas sp. Nm51]|nr:AAA ATPase domain-containing protein [Nitrosomonas sp. Nm51]